MYSQFAIQSIPLYITSGYLLLLFNLKLYIEFYKFHFNNLKINKSAYTSYELKIFKLDTSTSIISDKRFINLEKHNYIRMCIIRHYNQKINQI